MSKTFLQNPSVKGSPLPPFAEFFSPEKVCGLGEPFCGRRSNFFRRKRLIIYGFGEYLPGFSDSFYGFVFLTTSLGLSNVSTSVTVVKCQSWNGDRAASKSSSNPFIDQTPPLPLASHQGSNKIRSWA